MAIDVTEATFESEVIERSRADPGRRRFLGRVVRAVPDPDARRSRRRRRARGGRVLLAKVDVDSNQAISARYGVQGIPAVKAFRDGEVASEFVGAVPKAKVEEFFDSLVPSRADELLAAGDELSLREASELEPRRADIAVALAAGAARARRRGRGAGAVEPHQGDFAADGIAARIEPDAGGGRHRRVRGPRPRRPRGRPRGPPRGDRRRRRARPARTSAAPWSASSAKATRPIPPRASTGAAWRTRPLLSRELSARSSGERAARPIRSHHWRRAFPVEPAGRDAQDRLDARQLQLLVADADLARRRPGCRGTRRYRASTAKRSASQKASSSMTGDEGS